MINILDLSLEQLKLWMKDNKESEFRAKQVIDWLYKGTWDFSGMNNIPLGLREKLEAAFYIGIPNIVDVFNSLADGTKKFLLGYKDGNIIETVVMKYKHGYSICLSTQVGCKMGCRFCASTVGGVVRNLTAGEMLSQIMVAQKVIDERISNVVLMGSGEPFDNFENVISFLSLVNAEYGLNIGQRHITLSTCGIVPKIYELADLSLQITLAISLHAPNDDLRKSMMPIANRYSIEELIKACKYYIEKTNRRITFEYSLVSNVNDSASQAYELSALLKDMLCHVNLIPINEVRENSFKKSPSENIKTFYNILTSSGIETTIRKEMGSDINAACGQLRRSYLEEKINSKGV